MEGFVLIRDDGLYVAVLGAEHSYTRDLGRARIFHSREAAERERCIGNEQIGPLAAEFVGGQQPRLRARA